MIELAPLRLANGGRLRQSLARFSCVGGNAAVRRIDDHRAARLAVDPQNAIARIDPERVVTADNASAALPHTLEIRRLGVRALAQLAANRRRGAIRIARLFAELDRRSGLAL